MRNHHPDQVSPWKRRGRGFLVWLGGIVAVLLGLSLVGAWYESMAAAADVRAYPPPGQMVDVGGYRLHINCVGTGSPTVVIDAGWGMTTIRDKLGHLDKGQPLTVVRRHGFMIETFNPPANVSAFGWTEMCVVLSEPR